MQELTEFIVSIDNLIQRIGIGLFVGIGVFLVVAFGFRRWYYDCRADRELDAANGEKEKAIQRVADEVRFWKTLYLRDVNKLSDDEIQKLVNLGGGLDPKESRDRLIKSSGRSKEA